MACSCCQPSPEGTVLQALLMMINKLDALGVAMATAAEQITLLVDKLNTQGAVITDIAADVAALLEAMAVLQLERENLTLTGQAALDAANTATDSVTAALQGLDTQVGDRDGSDTPPAPTP